jgi:hypothetical protein
MKKTRVARWYIFKPKIPIWVNFGGLGILENVGIFYGKSGNPEENKFHNLTKKFTPRQKSNLKNNSYFIFTRFSRIQRKLYTIEPWRLGTVDIASASVTEDSGSNPARVRGFLVHKS